MGVGEVQPRPGHLDQHLARPGLRPLDLHEPQHLGAAELRDLGRAHGGAGDIVAAAVPVTVVGSIAYDAVRTPFGERERMLGGAATHFALAGSFFDEVRVVGPVGDDFDEADLELLRGRGVNVDDVEHVAGGRTFFWKGEYGWDLNSRETLDTQLGVFEGFAPKLSGTSR